MARRARYAVAIAGATLLGTASTVTVASDAAGDVAFLLGNASPGTVARVRGSCASGLEPAHITSLRQAGVTDLPDMVDSCVAALARLGHDGALGYVRDARDPHVGSALAFDSGFVSAYQKAEAIPPALPSMASVKPIAARCLAQQEPNVSLCSSAGYIYGARIARGEPVPQS